MFNTSESLEHFNGTKDSPICVCGILEPFLLTEYRQRGKMSHTSIPHVSALHLIPMWPGRHGVRIKSGYFRNSDKVRL